MIYARQQNHNDICKLLSRGPIASGNDEIKKLKEENRKLKEKIHRLKNENNELKNKELQSDEINKLNSFLSVLKEKAPQIEFFDHDEYEEASTIGEGATSTVKIVYKTEKEKYAKKELKSILQKDLQRFIAEAEILFRLRHPSIIRIYNVNFGDGTHPPSFILSLEPRSLESSIQKKELRNHEKNRITVELVLGMRFIHSKNFMHRDLKPSNILLSKPYSCTVIC